MKLNWKTFISFFDKSYDTRIEIDLNKLKIVQALSNDYLTIATMSSTTKNSWSGVYYKPHIFFRRDQNDSMRHLYVNDQSYPLRADDHSLNEESFAFNKH